MTMPPGYVQYAEDLERLQQAKIALEQAEARSTARWQGMMIGSGITAALLLALFAAFLAYRK